MLFYSISILNGAVPLSYSRSITSRTGINMSAFDSYAEEWSQIQASVVSKLDNDVKQQAGGQCSRFRSPLCTASSLARTRSRLMMQSSERRPCGELRWSSKRRTRS